jgi:nitroimidazol reductase NimA-like FMN-containing flavoprotein (pyridoxamine 5'-phosphate oxidase superfamily)
MHAIDLHFYIVHISHCHTTSKSHHIATIETEPAIRAEASTYAALVLQTV